MSKRMWSVAGVVGAGALAVIGSACQPPAATFTVTTTADLVDLHPGDGVCEATAGAGDCSLRAAVMEANTVDGTARIDVPGGTFALTRAGGGPTGGDLDVTGDVQVFGAGSSTVVDGGDSHRAFTTSGALQLVNVRVTNGWTSGDGGAVQVGTGGSLSAINVNLHANHAGGDGGAVHVADGASARIEYSSLFSNQADLRGGALHVAGGGTAAVVSSTVSSNRAGPGAGGGAVPPEAPGAHGAAVPDADGAAPPATLDPPALAAAATVDGRSRVIVTLATPEADAPAGAAVPEERLARRAQQAQVATGAFLDRMAPLTAAPTDPVAGAAPGARPPLEVRRSYTHVPVVALTVDDAGLAAVAEDPAVVGVEPDVAEPPAMAESIPFIGADRVHAEGHIGSGVAVAVLDTGVDPDEPMTDGKVVAEACYSLGQDGAAGVGDCPDGTSAMVGAGAGVACDAAVKGCDHGTHVASTAAGASRDIDGTTHTGVATGADIIAINVFSTFTVGCTGASPCALAYVSDQIAGLDRVLALSATHDIAAVNMSLGGGSYGSACDAAQAGRAAAMAALADVGIATVVSSGNNSLKTSIGAPACIDVAVSVGATYDYADTVASFSNSADILDLLAPGVGIVAELPNEPGDGRPDTGSKDGTSMAAPHVAGALAVLRAEYPLATSTQLVDALRTSGQPVADVFVTKPRISLSGAMALLDGTGIGGGIASSGTLTVDYSTIASNQAWWGGGIHIEGTTTLTASAVAYNGERDCAEGAGASSSSAGYTLDTDWSCPADGPTDLGRTFPSPLYALALNGGDTANHAIEAPNAMVDAIPPGVAGCGGPAAFDQLFAERPSGVACDIGAVEAAP